MKIYFIEKSFLDTFNYNYQYYVIEFFDTYYLIEVIESYVAIFKKMQIIDLKDYLVLQDSSKVLFYLAKLLTNENDYFRELAKIVLSRLENAS